MQSHFDHGGDESKPTGEIPMETRSRKWHSVEIVSVSSKSHIISSGASSRRRPDIRRGTFGGKMPAEDLVFDVEVDFSKEEEIYLGTWRRGLRPRFPPR